MVRVTSVQLQKMVIVQVGRKRKEYKRSEEENVEVNRGSAASDRDCVDWLRKQREW